MQADLEELMAMRLDVNTDDGPVEQTSPADGGSARASDGEESIHSTPHQN